MQIQIPLIQLIWQMKPWKGRSLESISYYFASSILHNFVHALDDSKLSSNQIYHCAHELIWIYE